MKNTYESDDITAEHCIHVMISNIHALQVNYSIIIFMRTVFVQLYMYSKIASTAVNSGHQSLTNIMVCFNCSQLNLQQLHCSTSYVWHAYSLSSSLMVTVVILGCPMIAGDDVLIILNTLSRSFSNATLLSLMFTVSETLGFKTLAGNST